MAIGLVADSLPCALLMRVVSLEPIACERGLARSTAFRCEHPASLTRSASAHAPPGTGRETFAERATEPLTPGFDAARFRFLKRLGSGGFGVVYLVRDRESDGDVALKTLRSPQPEMVYRLKREFRALADLRHKNLVTFYELFSEGDRTYFTMEYIRGNTFLRHVRDTFGVDYQRLRNAISQLATGLSVLHQAGKLHRDVKPSNVLVTPEERVVLLDFGLATEIQTSNLGESIEWVGTPAYASPEQARHETLTAASDWYSVGVLLYQALTDRLPFPDIRMQPAERRSANLTSPIALDAGVPAELSELCMALLADESSRRAGAREILALVPDEGFRPPAQTRRSVLFGREAELEQLRKALARVKAGEGVTVLLDGNSGVGKTTLVEHFLAQADGPDAAIVLRGRCYEREQVPYQGIDSLIDDLCRLLHGFDPVLSESVLPRHVAALVRLFPVLERVRAVSERSGQGRFVSVDERETRRQAFGGLRELLARIADRLGDRRSLIVHIDDLQWGDLDTAGLLRDLLRPPDAPNMLLILAYRSEDRERSPCVKALHQELIGTEELVHLRPLSASAAEELIRELVKSMPADLDVPKLASEGEGNPFLLQEVARFAVQEGGLSTSLDVHAALRSRIDRLPLPALELLQIVAVAGHPLTEQVARRAASLAGSATDAWRLLRDEHLVRFSGPPDGRLVEAFHDRVRETVVDSLTPQRARACHRGLAVALEQAGSIDPEVLARHHEAAGNPERALEFTVLAASQATSALAFDRAARLLHHAVVDLGMYNPAQRLKLRAALGEALGNAGRCVESARVYQEAADGAGPEARIELRRRAADQFLFAGKVRDGRELIRDDLRAHGIRLPRKPGRLLTSAVWLLAYVRLRFGFRERDTADIPTETLNFLDHLRSVSMVMSFVGLPRLGAVLGARFVLRTLQLGERRLIVHGLALFAAHSGAVAPFSRRTKYLFEQIERHGGELHDPSLEGTVAAMRGVDEYYRGKWRAAVQKLDDAERVLRDCPGTVWLLWSAYHVGIWARFFLGDWRELRLRVTTGLRDARDRDNSHEMAGMCSPFGVVAWLAKNEPDEARRTLQEIRAKSAKGFPVQHYWFLVAESLVRLYLGDGPAAWEEIRVSWRSAAILGFHLQLLHLRGCCALGAAEQVGIGLGPDLIKEAEWSARRIRRIDLPYAAPLAELLRAGIAAQRNFPRDASRHLEGAILELDRQEMPVYAAAARRRLARLRGDAVPEFLPGQEIIDPDAITRMLVPGFHA
jgi:eukaryotic-like serine/threonine-protein kinase